MYYGHDVIGTIYSPKESSLKNLSKGSLGRVAIITLSYWFQNCTPPYDIWSYCVVGGGGSGGGGGGGAYFTKKIDLSVFIPQFSSSFIC